MPSDAGRCRLGEPTRILIGISQRNAAYRLLFPELLLRYHIAVREGGLTSTSTGRLAQFEKFQRGHPLF